MSKKLLLAVLGMFLILPGIALGQSAVITGQITDSDGETLPGANVLIEQLSLGASTDIDGRYRIDVPARSVKGQTVTLTARFVGFKPESRDITVSAGEQTQNFELSLDLLNLDEVIVTGVVSDTPQKKLAFSVGKVSSDQLEQVPAVNAASALQGKVAGAKVTSRGGAPGQAADIRLRGSTSLTGEQGPLYIVDGVILEGTLADINAEDIESIEVVKGAAAASLYGSRAANGVVQIFTKRGQNIAEGRTRVTFRNEFGMSFLGNQISLSEHHPYLVNGQGQFIDTDGNVLAPGAGRVLDGEGYADNNYNVVRDLQRDVFDPGSFYTNYISIGRNTDGGNYQVSFSNSQEEGIIFGQKGYGRQNVRVNLDQRIVPGLDLAVSGLYGQSNNDLVAQGPGSPFFGLLFFQPNTDLFQDNPDGQPYYIKADPYSSETNPLYDISFNSRERDRTRFLGDFRLNWKPLTWFGLEGNFSLDRATNVYERLQPKGYLTEGEQDPLIPEPTLGELDKSTFNERAINTGITASANQVFGPLTTRLKLSYLYEDNHYEEFNANGDDFAVAGVPDLGAISGNKSINSFQSDVRSENVFAILGVDLKDRYIADFLIRRDGSSLFGEDERYATYYRVSGAYRISEDITLPGINEFKIRASRGTAGLRPGFSSQYETYNISAGVATKSTLGNRELKPAFSTETELGVNLDFLDRFSLEVSYADKVTEDQILLVPLSAAAGGFSSQWQNAGTLEAKTMEASLGAILMKTKNLTWSADLIFDRTRQEVTALNRSSFFVGPGEQNAAVFFIAAGEPFGIIYGNKWARSLDELPASLDPADYVINNQGYVIPAGTEGTAAEAPVKAVNDEGELVFGIGDINPDFNMGLSSSFRFKGFSIYGLLDWQQGGDVYNQTKQWIYRESRHGEIDQSDVAEGQKKAVNYYAAFYDANNTNDFFVEDATYLKLRELSVAYTFNSEQLNRVGVGRFLQRARIGLQGRNLLTFTGYSGYDPEVSGVSGDGTNYKFDGFGYPNFRTFTGSLELVF